MCRFVLYSVVALMTFVGGISADVAVKSFSAFLPSEMTLNANAGLNPTTSARTSAEQEILNIMRQYDVAQTQLDASFFEKIQADSFVVTLRNGSVLTKTQVIALMKTWDGKTEFRHEDLDIQIYGDTAIVTGWMIARPLGEQGSDFARWRSIYVFVNRDRGWQIISTTQVN